MMPEKIKEIAGLSRFSVSVKQWAMIANRGGHA